MKHVFANNKLTSTIEISGKEWYWESWWDEAESVSAKSIAVAKRHHEIKGNRAKVFKETGKMISIPLGLLA